MAYNVLGRILAFSLSVVLAPSSMHYAVSLMLPEARNLIVGGVEAPEGRYTYAVSLKDDISGHFCGGSLISKSAILTAAHCVAFDDVNVTVTIGRHNLTDSLVGEEIMIAETVLHPDYDMRISEDYDLAVVFLARPVSVDVDVVSINADGSLPVVGTDVTYLGWGEIDSNDATLNVSETLREVDSNVISNSQCNTIAGYIDGTSRMDSYEGLISEVELCTFSNGKDSCQKDSGGPVIMKGKYANEDVQVGVASWGIKCASNVFPGVAARTSSVYNWIKDTICNKEGIEPAIAFGCTNETHVEMVLPQVTEEPSESDEPKPSNLFEFDSNDERPPEQNAAAPDETLAEPDAAAAAAPTEIWTEIDATAAPLEILTEMDATAPAETLAVIGNDVAHDPIEMRIEIPDHTNDFEGDTTRSFATISQRKNAIFDLFAFAVVAQIILVSL